MVVEDVTVERQSNLMVGVTSIGLFLILLKKAGDGMICQCVVGSYVLSILVPSQDAASPVVRGGVV